MKSPCIMYMLKCLNQCFARLRSWKSVFSKTAVDPSSRFCEFEALFQYQSCAKHWSKNLKILNSTANPANFHPNWTHAHAFLPLNISAVGVVVSLFHNHFLNTWIPLLLQKGFQLFLTPLLSLSDYLTSCSSNRYFYFRIYNTFMVDLVPSCKTQGGRMHTASILT